MGARTGDLVAGEEEKKPAFALADYAPWRYRLGSWRCQCYGLLRFARNDGFGVGAGFGGIGGEGGKAAGEKDEAVPDGPFQVLLKGARLFVGAEDLAEERKNPGETVSEGLCACVNYARHALILHRSGRVRKTKKEQKPPRLGLRGEDGVERDLGGFVGGDGFEVGDHVGAHGWAFQAAIGHDGAGHVGVRVGEESVEGGGVPNDF